MRDINVGDRVLATMNGKEWFPGVLCGEIDLFVPYGVRLDDGELRYFAGIKHEHPELLESRHVRG